MNTLNKYTNYKLLEIRTTFLMLNHNLFHLNIILQFLNIANTLKTSKYADSLHELTTTNS